jgi:hypothetical protein
MSRDPTPQDLGEITVLPETQASREEDRYGEPGRSVGASAEATVDVRHESRRPEVLSPDPRAGYRDRYQLSDLQIRTLADLGRFRVIATHDVGRHVFAHRTDQASKELGELLHKSLIRKGVFEGPEAIPRELLTLTERGHTLVRARRMVPEDQGIYHGFVKPRDSNHDADLYLLYQKEAARIEKQGGRTLRVVLDYELKRGVNRDIARFGTDVRAEIARRHGLRTVEDKIPIPDMRIEYQTEDGSLASVNLELVTEHYRSPKVAEKARAGFSLYAPSGGTAHLRRALDRQALRAEIFSL